MPMPKEVLRRYAAAFNAKYPLHYKYIYIYI